MENVINSLSKVSQEYAVAYYEILEILKRLDINEYNKIPRELIEKFEKQKSQYCNFQYNDYKELKEQNITIKTKEILAVLFIDYLATENEKDIIKRKQEEYKKIKEKRLNEKYDPSKIFGKKEEKNIINEEQQPLVVYKKPFYLRILEKIKNYFR